MKRTTRRKPKFENFTKLLNSCKYNATNLSDIMHRSKPTMYKRMRNLEDLTIGDLIAVKNDGLITMDEILDALRKDLR